MKQSPAYIILLLVLVAVIAVLGFLIVQRKAPAEEPVPTAAPEIHPPVEDTPVPVEDTPAPTEAPPTETPEPTEEPVFETRPPIEETPEPSPTPIAADASGSFRSDTGTGLNLVADWSSFTAPDGARKLQVDVSAQSYSFFTSALYQSITLSVDGKAYSANSVEIAYDGSELVTTPMASFTVDAPAPGSSVTVTWAYKGSYSGKELNEIVASGTVR